MAAGAESAVSADGQALVLDVAGATQSTTWSSRPRVIT